MRPFALIPNLENKFNALIEKQRDYQGPRRSHRTSSAVDQPWTLEHQPTFDPSARRWPSTSAVEVVAEHSSILVVVQRRRRWTSTLKAAAQEGLEVPAAAPVLLDWPPVRLLRSDNHSHAQPEKKAWNQY